MIDLFRRLPWPGNVRQVLNVMRNIVVLNPGGLVTLAMLPDNLGETSELLPPPDIPTGQGVVEPEMDAIIGRPLAEVERMVVMATLERHGGSVPKAARVLDLSPSTLYRKLESWGKPPAAK